MCTFESLTLLCFALLCAMQSSALQGAFLAKRSFAWRKKAHSFQTHALRLRRIPLQSEALHGFERGCAFLQGFTDYRFVPALYATHGMLCAFGAFRRRKAILAKLRFAWRIPFTFGVGRISEVRPEGCTGSSK